MKKIISIITSLCLLFTVIGCQDNYESDYLNFASQDLYMQASASSQVIEVKSNRAFVATVDTVGAKWLSLSVSGKNLLLSAKENPTSSDRQAFVTVTAGKLKQGFNVIQLGQALSLNILPQTLSFDNKAGQQELIVNSNYPYELVYNAGWVSIKKDSTSQDAGKYIVTCLENKGKARVAHVDVVIENTLQGSISISQAGVLVQPISLPILMWGGTSAELKAKEADRGSDTPKEKDLGQSTSLEYACDPSQLFGTINYMFQDESLVLIKLFGKENIISDETQATFIEFLLANGYEKIQIQGYANSLSMDKVDKDAYVNLETSTIVEFMTDKKQNYTLKYYPHQPKALPTISTKVIFEFTKGITKQEVMDNATKNGEVYDEAKSELEKVNGKKQKYDILYFTAPANDDGWVYTSAYVFYPDQDLSGLTRYSRYFNDYKKFFWQGLDGKLYLTDEFLELVKENGFELVVHLRTGTYIFKDKTRSLSVTPLKDKTLGYKVRINIYAS